MHESGVPFCGRPLFLINTSQLIFFNSDKTKHSRFIPFIYTNNLIIICICTWNLISIYMMSGKLPSEWVKGNVIGSGSFGSVHLVVDTTSGSLFVVKSARSECGMKSLKNEGDILQSLNSPHIVKCMGMSKCRRSLFFEYMGGGSISDLMHKMGGSLQEKLIRLYTRQILQGLKYLHDNAIVHSDIKCTNLLLDASGTVKLTDFGCATKRKNNSSSSSCIGGTPLWMAPEVLRHQALDFSADIWSLGCTVIEMATGRPPWGAAGDGDAMAAVLEIARGDELPEFPKHFSAEGVDFLCRCLEREPGKRWTTERLLNHPFVKAGVSSRNMGDLSPTSVLDVATYDSDASDDDDDDDDNDFDFVRRNIIPFSMKKLNISAWENHSDASDGWITVRSRS